MSNYADELETQVRTFREQGLTPKQIARTLGVSPATVSQLVRVLAAERAQVEPEHRVVKCLVNAGWSEGLIIRDGHDWPDVPEFEAGVEGLVSVLIVSQDRRHRLVVCCYLVDVYCLGVKNVIGPRRMNDEELARFLPQFFGAYGTRPLAIPVELANELVFGAVAFARRLGFEPPLDFADVAGYLGSPRDDCSIEFGHKGKPRFVQGPNDDAERIMTTLERTIGPGKYDFIASGPHW